MTTESHEHGHGTGATPHHAEVSFEKSDVQTGSIYGYLMALGLAVVVSLVICIFIFRFTLQFAASSDTPPPPSRAVLGADYRALPPEPRLQGVPGHETDPQQDMRNKFKSDNEENEQIRWIDRASGIAQIPVKDAMKIIAEKGLPAVSAPPAEKKK
jgi:7-keto-8-aminopelargonate synthetase-like enzyme